jgi:hypothetical protein
LFLFLLLEGHIVVLPGVSATGTPAWQALGIYGFAAGFSEPFLSVFSDEWRMFVVSEFERPRSDLIFTAVRVRS